MPTTTITTWISITTPAPTSTGTSTPTSTAATSTRPISIGGTSTAGKPRHGSPAVLRPRWAPVCPTFRARPAVGLAMRRHARLAEDWRVEGIGGQYIELLLNHKQPELAETFFNS